MDNRRWLISIIIPVYNEQGTIKGVVDKLVQVRFPENVDREIIIVDDGSIDRTPQIISELRDSVALAYNSLINLGKGAAVRIGIEIAKGDIVVIQDADYELNPDDIPQLVAPIIAGNATVVYGSRFTGKRDKRMTLVNYLGNRLLTTVTNALYATRLTDMETGYKVFRKNAISGIRLRSAGFEIEPELTAKFLRFGHHIHEVPVSYRARTVTEGKKIGVFDGLKTLYYLIKYRFQDIRCMRLPAKKNN